MTVARPTDPIVNPQGPALHGLVQRAALAIILAGSMAGSTGRAQPAAPQLPHPILFVTQVPVPADFTTVASVFGNHRADLDSVARGGGLWIRYPDGALRNLTAAAGYGTTGFQGTQGIAVREPAVHWSGTKAVFSMVVGGTAERYRTEDWYWQLYEVSGLAAGDTPVVTRVPNQPADYNNVSPIYGTDDRIIFTSDRPRSGARHHYPQRDEYEEAPTVTGLWSLDPATGDLNLLQHSPSGSFSPQLDSAGRIVYVRWDHLMRDQQADGDAFGDTYGTFNFADESAAAARLDSRAEVFPEPRPSRTDLLAGTNLAGHTFNQFFPWMINEDGTEEETLNHVGRHEFNGYFDVSLNDDPNLTYHHAQVPRANPNVITNFLQVREDPASPGTFYGVDAPEFSTHAAGQIIRTHGAVGVNPDQMTVTYITHRDTSGYTDTPGPDHSGLYRNPLALSNGVLVAVHTPETRRDQNTGSRAAPGSRYDFRIKTLRRDGDAWVADQPLTPGIQASVSYYDPDVLVSYSGPLWELDPVEVRPRVRPARHTTPLGAAEQQVFAERGVSVEALQTYMRQRGLALIVSHDVTTRDRADRQQPYNLRVAGTSTQTIGATGRVYDVSFLQILQGDQLRGIGGRDTPRAGRRVLAQYLHDPAVRNPAVANAPPGSVAIAADGSVAAFVPARRALSWQLTDASGVPVVRERYWLTMQPGEVRVCASCHGVNTTDQAGHAPPANPPEALRQLLTYWQTDLGGGASTVSLAVSKSGTGSGTVGSSPVGIACGATCTAAYPAGGEVTLAATADAGAVFAGWSGGGCAGTGTCTVTLASATSVTATFSPSTSPPVAAFRRYLAEGIESAAFNTRIALANPGARAAAAQLQFLRADGVTIDHALAVPALAVRHVEAQAISGLSGWAFATVVTSDVPLVVDRSVTWSGDDGVAYGSHADTSVEAPSTRWFLAEGATHSGLDLFYLIENPAEVASDFRVRYLRPSGAPLEKTYRIGPRARMNIWVNHEQFPDASGNLALAATDVSADIESLDATPIIVERALYLSSGGVAFRAGHESAGITAPATRWWLAEGATGPMFDEFVLLANPNAHAAEVRATFLRPDGVQVVRTYVVGPNQRQTVWVDHEDPRLADTAVSAVVEATNGVPIVVERSMWWPGASATWTEAHNSPGATDTGVVWAVGDGEVSTAPVSAETYYLVANLSTGTASVKVTLLFEDGSPAVTRTFAVGGNSRFNVSIRDEFPAAVGRRFGGIVESLGAGAAPLVVERAMYSNQGATMWAAGSNILATRLQ